MLLASSPPFEQLLVLIDVGGRRTVVAPHEGAHERVAVLIGIPHQLAHHVGPHLGETAAPFTADLREVHRDVVLSEQLDVLLQDREVGERREHVVEVDAVVPDEEVVADGRPPLQRLYEIASRSVVRQRNLPFAVDVAEHDVDIRARLDVLGRMHCIEVGQRRELLVGETVGQAVQEMDQTPRRTPLALIESPAPRARAVGEVAVVLAHRDRVHPGIGPEDGVDLRADHFEEFGIGQTPLARLARTPLSVDEGVVFGMALSVDVRRQNAVEGMDPVASGKGLLGLLEAEPVAVEGLLHRIALTLPEPESRILGMVHLGNRHLRMLGQPIGVVPVVGHAEVLFQKGHNAVNRPFAPSAGDQQPAVVGSQAESILGQSAALPGVDDNISATGFLPVRHHRQLRPADASDKLPQQRGSPHVHRIGRIGDNPRDGLSMLHDLYLSSRREGDSCQAQGIQPVLNLHILQFLGSGFAFRQAISVWQVNTLSDEITKRELFYDKPPSCRIPGTATHRHQAEPLFWNEIRVRSILRKFSPPTCCMIDFFRTFALTILLNYIVSTDPKRSWTRRKNRPRNS